MKKYKKYTYKKYKKKGGSTNNQQLRKSVESKPLLDEINKHSNDLHINFFEDGHIYEIDGDSNYISVTRIISRLFKEFDTLKFIERLKKSKNPKYIDKSPRSIQQEWDQIKEESALSGTLLHKTIEEYSNGILDRIPESIETEFSFFLNFEKDLPYLEPYRTEWFIYDTDYRIAGSIDMVYIDKRDNSFHIYDWKRTKKPISNTKSSDTGYEPFNDIPNNNYSHYSLQLNLYKFLLEKNYDIKISSMTLCRLHPNNTPKNYQLIPILDMTPQIELLLDIRSQQLERDFFDFKL